MRASTSSKRHESKRGGRWAHVRRALLAAAVGLSVLVVSPPQAGADPVGPFRGASCGGQEIPKAPGSAHLWDCTFNETFGGTQLGSRWKPVTTANDVYFSGPWGCFVNSPNNIKVQDGSLRLTARKEAAPLACPWLNFDPNATTPYTAASVTTATKFSQRYGRFEVRAKLPNATISGVQFSFWLWPELMEYGPNEGVNGVYTPRSGEIDIMEWYSSQATLGIPTMHYVGDDAPGLKPDFQQDGTTANDVTKWDCAIADVTQWHTYTLEWTPTAIKTFHDGQPCLNLTTWNPTNGISKPAPFDKAFNINLTQALGADALNPVTASTPLPATTMIDYVYVWK
jgi:beta-glucanase (GH16 family)